MAMKDYSQWGEQFVITNFFKGVTGRFLDLGAFDGVTGSNTRALALGGWSGLCVEANPLAFADLLRVYESNPSVECLCAAVMDRPGVVDLESAGQVSNCIENEVIRPHVSRKFGVAGVTLDQIVERYGGAWDFVSIDVEGIEPRILPAASRILENTLLVCVEDALPGHEFRDDYYRSILDPLADMGFTKIVGRTTIPGRTANTLIAKAWA